MKASIVFGEIRTEPRLRHPAPKRAGFREGFEAFLERGKSGGLDPIDQIDQTDPRTPCFPENKFVDAVYGAPHCLSTGAPPWGTFAGLGKVVLGALFLSVLLHSLPAHAYDLSEVGDLRDLEEQERALVRGEEAREEKKSNPRPQAGIGGAHQDALRRGEWLAAAGGAAQAGVDAQKPGGKQGANSPASSKSAGQANSGGKAERKSGTGSGIGAEDESGAKSGVRTGIGSDTESGVSPGVKSGAESGVESEKETGSESGAGSGHEFGHGSGSESGTESDSSLATLPPSQLLATANEAWQQGEYVVAASRYRALIERGVVNEDLLFNWGTAELRSGRRGHAILAFERGLRLAPADPDLRFNLEIARQGNIDKVDGEQIEPSWLERLAAVMPHQTLGWLFVLCWPLTFLALAATRWRRLSSRTRLSLAGLGGLATFLALISGLGLLLVAYAGNYGQEGVVVSESAVVREGPARAFKGSFEIHEGSKVRLLKHADGFVRIRLSNGSEGWVDAAEVPAI